MISFLYGSPFLSVCNAESMSVFLNQDSNFGDQPVDFVPLTGIILTPNHSVTINQYYVKRFLKEENTFANYRILFRIQARSRHGIVFVTFIDACKYALSAFIDKIYICSAIPAYANTLQHRISNLVR